jgi:hypothetical protein
MTLDFSIAERQPKKRKSLTFLLTIGTIVGTITLGSTLAASINLNDSGPVEFGQGVTQTTACDSGVEVTPNSSFVNSEGGGDFKFSAITLSNLDGTDQTDASDEGCAGKSFTIKSYDSDGNLLTPTYSITLDGNGEILTPDGDWAVANAGQTDSSVNLLFDLATINAESVYRITLESSSPTNMAFLTTTDIDITSPLSGDSIGTSLPYQVSSSPVARIFIYPGSGTITATVVGPGVLGTSNENSFARALVLSRDPNSAINLYFFADGTYGTSTISITVSGQQNVKTVNFGHSSNGF